MSNRDTYNASVAAAAPTKTASITTNQLVLQEAIHAVGCNIGVNLSTGASLSTIATINAAARTKTAQDTLAEMNRQVAINIAKDTLRSTGDTAPA